MDAYFYVYVIFRQTGEPCYVGKGHGGRWSKHVTNARNPHLRNIYNLANGDLPVVKIREGLTEEEAFAIETVLIAALGREQFGGPLVNLTDGGEGSKGYQASPELRAYISEKSLKMWKNEEIRKKIMTLSKSARATPEFSTKRSDISKEVASREGFRDRMSETRRAFYAEDPSRKQTTRETTKAAMASEEIRARVSAAQKKRFENPEQRAKQASYNTGRKQSDEEKERRAASLRGQKRTPEQRAKMSAWQVGRKMSDEARAKMSEAAKRRASDPEYLKALSERGKKGSRKRWGNA